MAVIEELIAKLGLRFTGGNDTAKFLRELDKIKRASKEASKGFDFKFGGKSGLSRAAADAERAAKAFRRMREEAARASRVRFPSVMPVGPGARPGTHPGGGTGKAAMAGAVAGGAGAGGVGALASVGAIVAALNRFGTLETAQVELAKTTEKTKEEVQPAVDRFKLSGPKYGTTATSLVGAASAYAAAGVDYDTSIESAELTAKAAKAGSVEIDKAAAAAIVFMQNLEVKVSDLEKAFDYSIKGGKLGKAEFKESAAVMPELAASGSKIGLKGLSGVRDLIAALTVVRESAATTSQAADFLRDFMEKMSAPTTVKSFKKAGIDVQKEMKDADKKGVSRLDRMLDLAGKYTQGDAFKEAELFGDLQARNAMSGLLKKRDKYEEFKGTIEREAPGTMQADLAKSMDTFNSSVERFGATVDRLMVGVGEVIAPAARAGLDAASAADQARRDGKGQTPGEANAMVEKLNKLLGAPPTYHNRLGGYGGITASNFEDRFNTAAPDKRPAFMRGFGKGMTAPSFGSLGDRANWMGAGAAKAAGVTNNYENTGNDQRTQNVTVQQTVNGVSGVAASAAAGAKEGLASMGPSLVKANSLPTGGGTAASPAP